MAALRGETEVTLRAPGPNNAPPAQGLVNRSIPAGVFRLALRLVEDGLADLVHLALELPAGPHDPAAGRGAPRDRRGVPVPSTSHGSAPWIFSSFDAVLATIETARPLVEAARAATLLPQDRVARELSRCDDALVGAQSNINALRRAVTLLVASVTMTSGARLARWPPQEPAAAVTVRHHHGGGRCRVNRLRQACHRTVPFRQSRMFLST